MSSLSSLFLVEYTIRYNSWEALAVRGWQSSVKWVVIPSSDSPQHPPSRHLLLLLGLALALVLLHQQIHPSRTLSQFPCPLDSLSHDSEDSDQESYFPQVVGFRSRDSSPHLLDNGRNHDPLQAPVVSGRRGGEGV